MNSEQAQTILLFSFCIFVTAVHDEFSNCTCFDNKNTRRILLFRASISLRLFNQSTFNFTQQDIHHMHINHDLVLNSILLHLCNNQEPV